MTAATMLVTYLWHYLVARLLYDEFAGRNRLLAVALIAAIAGVTLAARSLTRRARGYPGTRRRR